MTDRIPIGKTGRITEGRRHVGRFLRVEDDGHGNFLVITSTQRDFEHGAFDHETWDDWVGRRPAESPCRHSLLRAKAVPEPHELQITLDVQQLEIFGGQLTGKKGSTAPERDWRDPDMDLVQQAVI